MKTIKIIKNIEIAEGIFLLSFKKDFDFIPGQVIKITSDTTVAPRLYSIASGIHLPLIQIVYDIKPEGELTNKLKTLKTGDDILVWPPMGNFMHRGGETWWIATGTGIAPFYSMFSSGVTQNVTLLHGVRRPEFLLFKDEFEALGKAYIACCSGKQTEGIFNGRVTDYLNHHTKVLPADAQYYLCGSAEMVVDVRDLLIEKHIPFGNIFSEIYF